MEITKQQISGIFQNLISCKITRDEAENWAWKKIKLHDERKLEFKPPQEKDKIWKALKFLLGIGTKISPRDYMHSIEDIRLEFKENWEL